MRDQDPIQHIEQMVKDMHDGAGKFSQPVLRRYPLLFAFLVVFSVAAILHGFELFADKIPFIEEHPIYLILAGVIALMLTGRLYHALKKIK